MVNTVVTLKTRVEKEIVDQIVLSLGNGTLTAEEAQQVAKDTLLAIDIIEKHERTVISFYEELAKEYKAFEILYTRIKGDILRSNEVTAYKDALSALNEGNVDCAKNIATSAIDTTADEANIN